MPVPAPPVLAMADAQAWVLIIGSIVTGVLSIITASVAAIVMVRTGRIHTLVNSALDAEKLKVSMRDALLLAKDLELASAEKARLALAATVAPPLTGAGPIPVEVIATVPVPVTVHPPNPPEPTP